MPRGFWFHRNFSLVFGSMIVILLVCFVLAILGSDYNRKNSATDALSGMPEVRAELRSAQNSTNDEASRALSLAQANKANGEAAQGYGNANLSNEKAITEKQTRDHEKIGWVGVFLQENAGNVFGSYVCVFLAGAVFLLSILFNFRPRKK